MLRLKVTILVAENLKHSNDFSQSPDPYVKVVLNQELHQTKIQKDTLSPQWNEDLFFEFNSIQNPTIYFDVMDWDRFKSDDTMGSTHYTLQPPYKTDIWLPLDTQGKLHVAFNAYEPTQSYSQFQYGQHGIAVRAVTDTTPTLHGVQSFNPGAFAQNINMMEFDRLRPKTLSATDGNYLSGSYYASQWGLNIPYRGAPASVP